MDSPNTCRPDALSPFPLLDLDMSTEHGQPTTLRWNSDEIRAGIMDAESLVFNKVKSLWAGFIDFALQENVLQVAVGVTYVQCLDI